MQSVDCGMENLVSKSMETKEEFEEIKEEYLEKKALVKEVLDENNLIFGIV